MSATWPHLVLCACALGIGVLNLVLTACLFCSIMRLKRASESIYMNTCSPTEERGIEGVRPKRPRHSRPPVAPPRDHHDNLRDRRGSARGHRGSARVHSQPECDCHDLYHSWSYNTDHSYDYPTIGAFLASLRHLSLQTDPTQSPSSPYVPYCPDSTGSYAPRVPESPTGVHAGLNRQPSFPRRNIKMGTLVSPRFSTSNSGDRLQNADSPPVLTGQERNSVWDTVERFLESLLHLDGRNSKREFDRSPKRSRNNSGSSAKSTSVRCESETRGSDNSNSSHAYLDLIEEVDEEERKYKRRENGYETAAPAYDVVEANLKTNCHLKLSDDRSQTSAQESICEFTEISPEQPLAWVDSVKQVSETTDQKAQEGFGDMNYPVRVIEGASCTSLDEKNPPSKTKSEPDPDMRTEDEVNLETSRPPIPPRLVKPCHGNKMAGICRGRKHSHRHRAHLHMRSPKWRSKMSPAFTYVINEILSHSRFPMETRKLSGERTSRVKRRASYEEKRSSHPANHVKRSSNPGQSHNKERSCDTYFDV